MGGKTRVNWFLQHVAFLKSINLLLKNKTTYVSWQTESFTHWPPILCLSQGGPAASCGGCGRGPRPRQGDRPRHPAGQALQEGRWAHLIIGKHFHIFNLT